MKKLLFLFAMSLCSLGAWAHDFSSVASTGQTLYYKIISGTTNVEVTYPGITYGYSGFTAPSGALTIPSTVTNNGITYSVTNIGNSAFEECNSLTSVTIPSSVTSIGNRAFSYCHLLNSVSIPNSVTIIGASAFDDCYSLKNVTIGNSVTNIGNYAFRNCRFTSFTIPNSVTYIGEYAFRACNKLTSVTIGNSVTTIGYSAFAYCSSLTSVTIPNSVTSMGNEVFSNCSALTSVIISNSLTSIGNYTFNNCNALTNVIIPNSLTSIGNYTFNNCTNLTSVIIPNLVTSIGNNTFSGCSSLTSVTIPNSVTSIGNNTFSGCSSLTSVTIPNSVFSIGSSAFSGCSGLSIVIIPNSVSSIGSSAFSSCSNLKTVYNLSGLYIGTTSYGLSAKRVINPTKSGNGKNAIYKISTSYSFVDAEDNVQTHIPRSTIPANFIYNDNGWKAKTIVLTDGVDAFEAPETFTAETATYTREFTDGHRSTLYLPFTASVPSGLEVYDFTSFANNTISFTEHTGNIVAYTPYLVGYDLSKDGNTTKCTITKTNAVFPKSESASYHPVTCNNMTFSGVISRTQMTSTNNYGYSNGFFVQSGGSAHVNPFRCYFTYNPPAGAPQNLPTSLFIDCSDNSLMGIGDVENPNPQSSIRYSDDVYDTMGRLVRKHAKDLEGLPRGIYIWKGKKVLRFQ